MEKEGEKKSCVVASVEKIAQEEQQRMAVREKRAKEQEEERKSKNCNEYW